MAGASGGCGAAPAPAGPLDGRRGPHRATLSAAAAAGVPIVFANATGPYRDGERFSGGEAATAPTARALASVEAITPWATPRRSLARLDPLSVGWPVRSAHLCGALAPLRPGPPLGGPGTRPVALSVLTVQALAMLLALALVTAAHAAPLSPTVGGLDAARAVQVLIRNGDQVNVADCNDAAVGADAAIDGRWTCGPVAQRPEQGQIGLLVDGKLTEVGEARWEGPARALSIRRESGAWSLSTESELNPEVPGAIAAGPGQIVVLRVEGFSDSGAPVIRLQGEAGSVQLSCGDDGRFPDVERNDGRLGCAGLAPGRALTASLYGAGGSQSALGQVTLPDDAVAEVVVDVAAGRLEPRPFGAFSAVLAPEVKVESVPPAPRRVYSRWRIEGAGAPAVPPPDELAPTVPLLSGDPARAPDRAAPPPGAL